LKTLKDLFLAELANLYDSEQRIVKALPKLAKAATCTHLKAIFLSHLKESETHVTKLEAIFRSFDVKPHAKTCVATIGLLEEGDQLAAEFKDSPALNALLIVAAQKVEHYEMASYGGLHAWAELLDNAKAADLLEEILAQERAANAALKDLALTRTNQEALGKTGSHMSSADEELTEETQHGAGRSTAEVSRN
jgi:ferritin-like metal-binding protein YciE